jgi:murein DD-endopeptidase MepM/ murein hydrolase activator NlpD
MFLVLDKTFIVDDNYVVGGRVEGFPCDGQITQTFGMQSVTGVPHNGIDIAIYYRPVYAPSYGLITGVNNWGTFGNWVVMYHGWDEGVGTDLYSVYAHLSAFSVAVGEVVQPGQQLGVSGNTGLSFGAHLHWGFSRDANISGIHSRNYDPYIFIKRAEEEQDMMAEYERGLLSVASGDFKTMLSCYDVLDAAGYFAAVNESDGVAPPYNPGDDTATELNASLVRSKRINFLACDIEAGPKAWALIK